MIQRRHLSAIAAALVVAALANAPARAAFFEDEDARKRIEATNQKLNQVQRQLEDRIGAIEDLLKSQGLIDIFNQIELLKSDVARLRGQLRNFWPAGIGEAEQTCDLVELLARCVVAGLTDKFVLLELS